MLRYPAAAEHRRRAAELDAIWACCARPRLYGGLRLYPRTGHNLYAARAGLWTPCAAFARAAAGIPDRGRAVRPSLLQPLLRPLMDLGERPCLAGAVCRRDGQPLTARDDPRALCCSRRLHGAALS